MIVCLNKYDDKCHGKTCKECPLHGEVESLEKLCKDKPEIKND